MHSSLVGLFSSLVNFGGRGGKERWTRAGGREKAKRKTFFSCFNEKTLNMTRNPRIDISLSLSPSLSCPFLDRLFNLGSWRDNKTNKNLLEPRKRGKRRKNLSNITSLIDSNQFDVRVLRFHFLSPSLSPIHENVIFLFSDLCSLPHISPSLSRHHSERERGRNCQFHNDIHKEKKYRIQVL